MKSTTLLVWLSLNMFLEQTSTEQWW